MNNLRALDFLLAVFLCLVFSTEAFAVIDPQAPVVKLRTTCQDGSVTLDNCFTTPTDLTSWLGNTRKPTIDNPLQVEVGPGTFPRIQFSCAANGYTGYISLIGAGRQQTIFEDDSINSTASGIIKVISCTNMHFSEMEITSTGYNYIIWNGGGMSTWNNVDVITPARAWAENSCGSTPGKHYWFGSRLVANTVFTVGQTYNATCDQSWFFGSQLGLTQHGTSGPMPAADDAVLLASGMGEIHVYGSNIEVTADSSQSTLGGTFYAAFVQNNGMIHIHGTGIDLISTTTAQVNFVAFNAYSGGMIHANNVAYNMNTAVGTITRINNQGGSVEAPYMWGKAQPPAIANVGADGQDMTVERVGTDMNLLVYNSNCTGSNGPWYNVATRTCR